MTFNQWAAQARISDGSMRLAFEPVWNALVGGGCSVHDAASMLTDLFESIPEPQLVDEDEW